MRNPDDAWPPPSGSPTGTSGWYLANDGAWYRSASPPAPGQWLAGDGRWYSAEDAAEPWHTSRWGLGDVWWGVLAYFVAGVAGLIGLVIVEQIAGGVDEDSAAAIAAFVTLNAVATICVIALATRRKGLASVRADFGLAIRLWDPLIGLGLGIAAVIVAGGASYGVDRAFGAEEATSNVPVDDLTSFRDFAVFFVAVAIITPIVEELFFRGLLYRSLLKRGRNAARAIVTTTLLFVVPHLPAVDTWPEVVSLFASIAILGLAFNLACHWTGNRLAAPIVAHVVVNGLASVALYLS
jgi:membrane protease YdiL (CAAX protease family)